MSLGEFELIERYFWRTPPQGPRRAVVGNGDDCAVVAPGAGMHLALSTDTLVEGRHFLSTVDPALLGHKALAVNLSDLAACGARPLGFTLALTLPRVDPAWLGAFSQGLLALADAHDCELLGGDTTAGPLSIGITALGEVPAGGALLRSGARVGDDLWVSGWPGLARLALDHFRRPLVPELAAADWALARQAMECPQPRIALGLALRGLASAALDISDGLLGDLRHLLRRSGVGATVVLDALPRHPVLAGRPPEQQLDCLLAGGDDYELLFTAAPHARAALGALSAELDLPLTRIGRIQAAGGGAGSGLGSGSDDPLVLQASGLDRLTGGGDLPPPVPNRWSSFDHFKA